MFYSPILKAAVVGLFLVVCLFEPAMAAGTWSQVRTKNFFLIGDAGELEIRRAGGRLEQFREAFRQLFPQMKLDGGVKTNVVVFKNEASYSPFKPKRPDGTVDEAIAGYFQAGEDVNYITLSVGDRSNPYGTIFHEYVHFLLDANVGRMDLPPWLGEGLAEYYETLQVLDDGRVSLGTPPNGHLMQLRHSELIPFKTFLATDNSSLHRGADDSRTLFYAQAWALTHYLLHSDKNKSGNHLDELLSALKKEESPGKVFEKILGPDQGALETALRKYIDQPLPPNKLVAIPKKADLIDTAMTAAPLSDAQASAYLGDLLYHTHNLTEAEVLLRKALAADSNSPVANMSLGQIYSEKRNFAEAKKYLEKAIAADKTNHIAYFNYAYAVSRESVDSDGNVSGFPSASANKMRDALHRAIAIDPGFAESYRLLAFVNLVNGNDLETAVDLIKRGLVVRPGDQQFNLLLAQVYLQQEKYEDAKTIATKVATAASDAEIWAEAQSILRTVNKYFAEKSVGANRTEADNAFGPLPPLILKRSAVSDSDVAKYEEERVLVNLNLLLEKPRFGEKQVVGYVDKISCNNNGINYTVNSGGERSYLISNDFTGIGLRVLTEGERSFTLDCGVSLGKQLTVLTFRPSPGSRPNVRGQLVSITFVPDNFRLKTPEELANRRTVIIEDDTLSRSRTVKTERP